jgi:polyferredoxin
MLENTGVLTTTLFGMGLLSYKDGRHHLLRDTPTSAVVIIGISLRAGELWLVLLLGWINCLPGSF